MNREAYAIMSAAKECYDDVIGQYLIINGGSSENVIEPSFIDMFERGHDEFVENVDEPLQTREVRRPKAVEVEAKVEPVDINQEVNAYNQEGRIVPQAVEQNVSKAAPIDETKLERTEAEINVKERAGEERVGNLTGVTAISDAELAAAMAESTSSDEENALNGLVTYADDYAKEINDIPLNVLDQQGNHEIDNNFMLDAEIKGQSYQESIEDEQYEDATENEEFLEDEEDNKKIDDFQDADTLNLL